MTKHVIAVAPFVHPDFLNFKTAAYEAWAKCGGATASSHYPCRALHGVFFRWELPTLWKSKSEARLRFMEPISMRFDTIPDYATHEIIPFVWDCWPEYIEDTVAFMARHNVKTAFFTSSQTADMMRRRLPDVNVFYIPEGIDTSLYHGTKPLAERTIDVLEFGRKNDGVLKISLPESVKHIYRKGKEWLFRTNEELFAALADTKITIALPRCDTDPQRACGIETLTQRYWETMLSEIIPLGRAPKELIDLVGYNPVITADKEHINEQILDMLAHIEDYQPLVDKNRETALRMGDWTVRMREVIERLRKCGYSI